MKKVSFTGSTEVGKLLMEQSSSTVKKVSLELGGNAPFIVFEDADLDEAVAGAIASKYRNAGQTCICANRLYVHENILEKFTEKFRMALSNLKVGNGLDEGISIGPLINEEAITKVKELINDAKNNGAKVIQVNESKEEIDRSFLAPSILVNVHPNMRISKEEIFGPVAPIYAFHSEEEVLQLANDTSFGLAAYFYGKDYAKIWRVAEQLEYGMVGINTSSISTPLAPFGGVKESGIGREGSKYGIEEFLEIKYLCFGGIHY